MTDADPPPYDDAPYDAPAADPTVLDADGCTALLDRLFPDGPGGDDVIAELAPGGWATSPLRVATRPGAGEDAESPDAESPDAPESDPPDDGPVDAGREVCDLVTRCVWDVFSDNHEVRDADGRLADLGSHRGSAGFLADWLNARAGHGPEDPDVYMARFMAEMNAFQDAMKGGDHEAMMRAIDDHARRDAGGAKLYEYRDFYMGTRMVGAEDGTSVAPVHRLIFRRLKSAGCDWTYSFPRIHLVDFRPLRDAMEERAEAEKPAWDYDPEAAVAAEAAKAERAEADAKKDEEIAAMRADLDAGYRESVDAAVDGPPPPVVAAYTDVYGDFPAGWPPSAE